MLDCEEFITHFTSAKNNAAMTKHSFFAERRKNTQKNKNQNVYRRPWHDMRCCVPAGKHNLQLLP